MQAQMYVVAGIKVTAEHSAKVRPDQALDDFPTTGMMVLIIANAGRADTPDVAIAAIFSPPRLIGLHRRTGADLPFERLEVGLHLFFESMEQLHNLSNADRDPMQGEQIGLDLSNGQTHERAQGGDQTGQAHPNASLTDHLLVQVHRSFIPAVAPCTPALVDPMVRDLYGWGRWHIDNLAAARQTQAS